MENIANLKIRFNAAFRRYRTHDAKLRELRNDAKNDSGPAGVNHIHMEWQRLCTAKDDYLAVRREYVDRLLTGVIT